MIGCKQKETDNEQQEVQHGLFGMERQGKSREEINTVLKEKFADKKPNPSA